LATERKDHKRRGKITTAHLDALLLVVGHETLAELLAQDVLKRELLHPDDVQGS
jgi:hypothetical protein